MRNTKEVLASGNDNDWFKIHCELRAKDQGRQSTLLYIDEINAFEIAT